MKLKDIILTLVVGGAIAGMTTAAVAKEDGEKKQDNAKLEAQAKIGKAEAAKIALAKVPGGAVKEAELEEEDGRLVWSIDLTTPGDKDLTEVLVDAKTGAVVSVEKEAPKMEKKEKKGEKKKKGEGQEDEEGEGDGDKD